MKVQTSILPSKEECYIKGRAVQIDKLKKKHFQSEAVLPLRFGTRLLCEEREQSFRGLIRLTVSLGTKAAHTYQSWQCICKLACWFQNISWQKKLYPKAAHSKWACKDLEISSDIWICVFPGDWKKVVEIMCVLNIAPGFLCALQAQALLLFPFLQPAMATLPENPTTSYVSAFLSEMSHGTGANPPCISVSWICPPCWHLRGLQRYQWRTPAWIPFLVPGNSSQKTEKKCFTMDRVRQMGKEKTYSSFQVGP